MFFAESPRQWPVAIAPFTMSATFASWLSWRAENIATAASPPAVGQKLP
ncbi:hypothetical protein APV28_3320 [Comamonas testosteroni]|nr:hypothetical protein APV28_3320 [Comamonas testosteroni]